MPAGLAFAWIRRQLVAGMDDDERLDVDVRLGMPGAAEERSRRRRELLAEMGVEVR